MNVSQRCTHAGMKIWGCINKSIDGTLRDGVTRLYLVCVRQNLKFCVQFGALQYKKGIGRLEKALRAAKMIQGLEHQRNEARLKEQSLFSLKKMLRGEAISMLNYLMAGYGENRPRLFLKMKNMRRRGSGEKFQ